MLIMELGSVVNLLGLVLLSRMESQQILAYCTDAFSVKIFRALVALHGTQRFVPWVMSSAK